MTLPAVRPRSTLDEIAGIGAKRKKALPHHFGSAQAVGRAGLADLEAVAEKFYDQLHGVG